MKENRAVRMVCGTGVVCVLALFFFAVLNALVDPFYHYHAPLFGREPKMYNAVYQTSGAAEHFSYDAAVIGTSLTENFRASWFGEMGLNCEKLSYPSATLNDYAMILDKVYRSGNEVKCIVMDISDVQLQVEEGGVRTHEAEFLNDDSLWNDYDYLLNMDVTKQSFYRLFEAAAGIDTDHDADYTWEDAVFFNEENCKKDTRASREKTLSEKQAGTFEAFDVSAKSLARQNLQAVTPYIEAHPETTFYVFLPPFSVLYWEIQELNGRMDWMLQVYGEVVDVLDAYENVEVLSFISEEWIISDLSIYRDSGHYSPAINRYIFDCIKDGTHRVDAESFREDVHRQKDYIEAYDFEAVWNP